MSTDCLLVQRGEAHGPHELASPGGNKPGARCAGIAPVQADVPATPPRDTTDTAERPTMTTVLAIDPGSTESAYVVIDADTCRPLQFGKIPNKQLRDHLWTSAPTQITGRFCAIEMIGSYGMAVGAEVFETCVWIGRFHTAIECATGEEPTLVKRQPIKLHHCHTSKAKDSNISQALVDRFAYGMPNRGKGTKADPGWFYGFAADVWQAYALAVYVADELVDQQASQDPVSAPGGVVTPGADTATRQEALL